jgi:alkanesulfonate monooxygenase SsuD/methylene tetrahydromethanopterin reductase-like flavin-dependent oxidoreductase (luciferase family)
MTGPKTLENHIIPRIGKGAESAGRPTPVIAAGFPIVLTTEVDAAKKSIDETLQIYGSLPSYRAMLDREGLAGPSDLALVGDEGQIRKQLQQLKDIGVTDFMAAIVATDSGAYQRTMEFLESEL